MYETITGIISKISDEAPNRVKRQLIQEIQNFVDRHSDYELVRYQDILKQNGLEWSIESMQHADVSKLNGQGVMALLVGAYRADYMAGGWEDGPWAELFESGCVKRWLLRLKEIDKTTTIAANS